MIRIGNGPNLEVFEISGQQSAEPMPSSRGHQLHGEKAP